MFEHQYIYHPPGTGSCLGLFASLHKSSQYFFTVFSQIFKRSSKGLSIFFPFLFSGLQKTRQIFKRLSKSLIFNNFLFKSFESSKTSEHFQYPSSIHSFYINVYAAWMGLARFLYVKKNYFFLDRLRTYPRISTTHINKKDLYQCSQLNK